MTDPRPVLRIGVIGLGAAGIAQIAQLLSAFSRPQVSDRLRLEVMGFEARDTVGGVWNYDEEPAPFIRRHEKGKGRGDEHQTWVYPKAGEDPTPMYDNLRTNLAHDLMSYRGYPFPPETPLFAERCLYTVLRAYALDHGVLPHVRFRTRVQRLYQPQPQTPQYSAPSRRWTVESVGPEAAREDEFDHVAVCNGHYSDPYIPSVPGLEWVSSSLAPSFLIVCSTSLAQLAASSSVYSASRQAVQFSQLIADKSSSFPGTILHSRSFRRPSTLAGQRVLVVGSYASANDITRLLSTQNNLPYYLPGGVPRTPSTPGQPRPAYTTIYQSGSGAPNAQSASSSGPPAPYKEYIETLPMISHLSADHFHFTSRPFAREPLEVGKVDTIIFATGYWNALPFCKVGDAPWSEQTGRLLDRHIEASQREGGEESEVGGMKGQYMDGMDGLLLFLKGDPDRSIAFPGLPYQTVPFPLFELQARLVALLWAGLLPDFPADPCPPPNTDNPAVHPAASGPVSLPALEATMPPTDETGQRPASTSFSNTKPLVRQIFATRKEFVFPNPYEWVYSRYLMSLMRDADKGPEVKEHWREIEPWREARRRDTTLRERTLGY